MDITPNDTKASEGRFYMNGEFPTRLPPNRTTYSHVDAWDPVTGKRVWSMPYKFVLLSSMLLTAGDLVFTGDPEGNFLRYASSGISCGASRRGGHAASRFSYRCNGRQYIAGLPDSSRPSSAARLRDCSRPKFSRRIHAGGARVAGGSR
jgi:hypothetical protein